MALDFCDVYFVLIQVSCLACYVLLLFQLHTLLITQGTRFFMRGIDTEGHVANFVETEQIAIHGTMKASFVQVQYIPTITANT